MTIKNDINKMLELTRQDAAVMLCVPLIYLDAFLAKEGIDYVGSAPDRRVRLHDVLAYKRKREAIRSAGLNELARMRARRPAMQTAQAEADLLQLPNAQNRQDHPDGLAVDCVAGSQSL